MTNHEAMPLEQALALADHASPMPMDALRALRTLRERIAVLESTLPTLGTGHARMTRGGTVFSEALNVIEDAALAGQRMVGDDAARLRATVDRLVQEHSDDAAVERFAIVMKAKLAAARAKGRGGWEDDEPGMQQHLSDLLHGHVAKGDPVDVANFCMFLHQRHESILPRWIPGHVAEKAK